MELVTARRTRSARTATGTQLDYQEVYIAAQAPLPLPHSTHVQWVKRPAAGYQFQPRGTKGQNLPRSQSGDKRSDSREVSPQKESRTSREHNYSLANPHLS